jgi:hypothetical protein
LSNAGEARWVPHQRSLIHTNTHLLKIAEPMPGILATQIECLSQGKTAVFPCTLEQKNESQMADWLDEKEVSARLLGNYCAKNNHCQGADGTAVEKGEA